MIGRSATHRNCESSSLSANVSEQLKNRLNLIAYDRFRVAGEVDAERSPKVGAVARARWNEGRGKLSSFDKGKVSAADSRQPGLAVFIAGNVNLGTYREVLIVVGIPAVRGSQIKLVVRRRCRKAGDANT